MKGISFTNLQEAREYQSTMKRQGYLAKIISVQGGYRVVSTGEAPEWKNDTKINNVSNALKDEDELP